MMHFSEVFLISFVPLATKEGQGTSDRFRPHPQGREQGIAELI